MIIITHFVSEVDTTAERSRCKSPTKAAIQNVVDYVMNQYKYTSLGEYNAVLKLYNVMADPG